jgi:acetamidase/formamidase
MPSFGWQKQDMTDHRLDPTPDNVHWGFFDATLKPALSVASGASVTIRTVSGGADILPPEGSGLAVLPEHRRILDALKPVLPGHILTGPVEIEGAEPGDVLEVRINDVRLIQDWGWNANRPLRGALPHRFPEGRILQIPISRNAMTAACPWGSTVPLRPFFGVMGVAPPPHYGRVSTIEPREYGGNIDNRELIPGTKLYLPVFVRGALFSTGDGHACQGDGEVNLTALETALEGDFTFVLHKQRKLLRPRAVTPTHLITMAFDPDLDDAATRALEDMIDAVVDIAGLAANDAYALCSLACDLRITQLVDGNKGVHAMLPFELLPRLTVEAIPGFQA